MSRQSSEPEIVYLLRLGLFYGPHNGRQVGQITVDQADPVFNAKMAKAPQGVGGASSEEPIDCILAIQQKFG